MAAETHNALSRARGAVDADPAVADQVRAWRRQRMSWSAIARCLGRSEPDTRSAYDEDWPGRAAR